MFVDAITEPQPKFRPGTQARIHSPRAETLPISGLARIDPIASHQAIQGQFLVPHRANELRSGHAVGCTPMGHVPVVPRPILRFGEDVDHHVVDEVIEIDPLSDRLVSDVVRDACIDNVQNIGPIHVRAIHNHRWAIIVFANDDVPCALLAAIK
jgi:hypothetical protein